MKTIVQKLYMLKKCTENISHLNKKLESIMCKHYENHCQQAFGAENQ